MAEEYPLVNQWATFFLYPFSFPAQQKDALSAILQKATDRWRRFTFSPTTDKEHFDELAYFFPYTKEFFTSQIDHFRFNLPEKGETEQTSSETTSPGVETARASLTVSGYDEVAPELTEVRVHFLPLGIGILSLRVEGKTPLPFGRLLDFNSDFRYLTEAYAIQPLPQITFEVGANRIPENTVTQPGLGPLVHSFLQEVQEVGGARQPQLLDNRLIVYSYAALKRDSQPQDYLLDEMFFKFLFVDKTTEPLPDPNFRQELLAKHEYRRWRNYTSNGENHSARFGFSRYSGVVMGQEGWFFDNLIFQHFRTMYYDMALILLFHRTALLKLSYDLSRVDIETQDSHERRDRVRQLRAQVLEFTNRYWFSEITNQDQGIEMFDCWKSALRNKDLFDEVHRELQEYDDQLRNLDAERLNNTVAILTAGGFLSLPVAFAAYFLAVSYTSSRIVLLPLLVIFFAAAAVFVVRKSAAIWDFFQDLLNPAKTLVAVCEEHRKRFVNYVRQVYKRVTGC